MSTTQQPTDVDIPEAGDQGGIGQAIGDYFTRVKGGEVGSLPAVLGLIVLFVFFSIMKPETFFTTFNFANLLNQSTAIIVLAMGLVFVLLLGEIDLSAGFTAGTAAAVLAVSIASWGVPWPAALVLGLLTGNLIEGAKAKLRAVSLDHGRVRIGAYGSDHEERPMLPPIARDRASALLGRDVAGDQLVIIGDTPFDVTCGRGVGARAIAVATGGFGRAELESHGPDAMFDDLSDTARVMEAIIHA